MIEVVNEPQELNRRGFLRSAALLVAGATTVGLAGCATNAEPAQENALVLTEEMMSDFEELVAKEAIRQKLYQYCRSVDRADAELGYAVFAEDSFVDYSPEFTGTGEELIDWVVGVAKESKGHGSHQLTNITIKVEGDKAGSEAYCRACTSSPNPEGGYFWFEGSVRYSDLWERRDGNWVIVERVATWDCAMTIPYQINREPINTSRDKSDPSYEVLVEAW